MEKIEEKIREKLAKKLDLFHPGLTLIEQESFLPNTIGTRGFVDILAKDNLGRYVIIELKRSNAASRQALHEILKYIEGIKENKSIKNDEILAYIVSTEWDELFIPFSSFVSQVSYTVLGFKLFIDDSLNPIGIEKVEPLTINNERLFSDQHSVSLYTNEKMLNKGINSHEQCFKQKGIQDYVLLILKAHPEFYEYNLKATHDSLKNIDSYFGSEKSLDHEKLKNLMPNYQYMIYSAVQVMNESEYWKILQKDPANYNEFLDISSDMEHEELLALLHEYAVENSEPRPYVEHYEIGYPAKLQNRILEDESWEIINTIRHGGFEKNVLLSDETILSELTGCGGTNKQKYTKEFTSENPASFEQIKKEISRCLIDNDIWLTGINKAIEEIISKKDLINFTGRIHIFNPSNTLHSLYKSATSSSLLDAISWCPTYYLNIETDKKKLSYFGCLSKNSNKSTFQNVLDKEYDGSMHQLLLSLTWGGYQHNDIDICPIYGLEYENFKCEIIDDNLAFYRFDGFRYKPCDSINPFSDYLDFMCKNKNFVDDVVSAFVTATITPGIVEF